MYLVHVLVIEYVPLPIPFLVAEREAPNVAADAEGRDAEEGQVCVRRLRDQPRLYGRLSQGNPHAREDVRELPGDGQPAEPVRTRAHAGQGADHHGREHQQDAIHVAL